jgi:hypothetical protein
VSPCGRLQDSAVTLRQRLWTLSQKAREYQRKNKDGTGMRTVNASFAHRCYVHLSLYNYRLLGMVETVADKSYMGGRAVHLCQSLNIPIDKFAEPQCVQLANQSTGEVMGSVKIPI